MIDVDVANHLALSARKAISLVFPSFPSVRAATCWSSGASAHGARAAPRRQSSGCRRESESHHPAVWQNVLMGSVVDPAGREESRPRQFLHLRVLVAIASRGRLVAIIYTESSSMPCEKFYQQSIKTLVTESRVACSPPAQAPPRTTPAFAQRLPRHLEDKVQLVAI